MAIESNACMRMKYELEAMGAVDTTHGQISSSSVGYIKTLDTREATTRAYFLESLCTALSHAEPLIAFRALLQAQAYAERCKTFPNERDLLIAARNRIENILCRFRSFEHAGIDE